MRPYFRPDRSWPDSRPKAHVYWIPRGTHDSLLRRHQMLREALTSEACVRVVDDGDLHLTLAMVDDADVDRGDLHHALAAATRHLTVIPFAVPGIVVGDTTITYDTTADHHPDWAELFTAVNTAVATVAAAPSHNPLPPHLTAAIGVADADSGAIASRLRHTLRTPITRTQLDHLAVCDVTQHPTDGRFAVRVLSRIPLRRRGA